MMTKQRYFQLAIVGGLFAGMLIVAALAMVHLARMV